MTNQERNEQIKEIEKKIFELTNSLQELRRGRKRLEEGQQYYVIEDGIVVSAIEEYNENNKMDYELHNYYMSYDEAAAALEKYKIYLELKELAFRINIKYIDWKDEFSPKYYLFYDYSIGEMNQGITRSWRTAYGIYCSNNNFLEEAKAALGNEKLLKLFKEGGNG